VRTTDINHAIAAISVAHHGLVSRTLADQAGVPAEALSVRARNGMLERVDREIYRFRGAPRTWEQRALVAVWAAGPAALLSHRAAALLHRLDGIEQAPMEVLVDRWSRRRRRRDVRLHEAQDIRDSDRHAISSIPCTSIVRTLLDLPAGLHRERADQALEDALRRRLCTVDEVADRFVQVARRGRPGTRVMRALLQSRLADHVPTMSEFERRTCRVLAAAGLDDPVRQHPVRLPDGRLVLLDLAWPSQLLALECDGLFDHATDRRLPWDDDRQNELQLLGWLVLRVTWATLHRDPAAVVRQVELGLRRSVHRSSAREACSRPAYPEPHLIR
jgi:very-short-patch-repair endonuclease